MTLRVRVPLRLQQVTKSLYSLDERVTLVSTMNTPKWADTITSYMSVGGQGCKLSGYLQSRSTNIKSSTNAVLVLMVA